MNHFQGFHLRKIQLNSASLRGLAVIVLVIATPKLFFGQAPQSSPAAPPQAQPSSPDSMATETLKSNVNEVTLDLVIKDKKHKPILDLKPEDLVVTDNDVPVKLTGFHLVTGADAESDHVVTLVFDHFTGPTAKAAQSIATKILKMLPSKGYSYTILDLPGRLRLVQDFTSNRNTAIDAVKVLTEGAAADRTQKIQLTYTGGIIDRKDDPDPDLAKATADAEKSLLSVIRSGATPSGVHVDLRTRAHDQALLAALQDSQKVMQDQHAIPNLAALLALIKSQQKISDRKSLVYFTQNMQMDSAGKEIVKTITGAAGQAGVSIYVVDLDAMNSHGKYQMVNALANSGKSFNPAPITLGCGPGGCQTVIPSQQEGAQGVVGAPSGAGPTWGMAQDVAQMSDFQRNGFDFRDIEAPKNPLADLAKNSGGVYIDAQDSVKKPLEQMLQDMTTFYQATYTPPIQEYDGSFRTIVAKPVRAGLNIRTKSGYYALEPGAEAGIRPFEVPLMKLFNPVEPASRHQFPCRGHSVWRVGRRKCQHRRSRGTDFSSAGKQRRAYKSLLSPCIDCGGDQRQERRRS